MRIPIKYGLTRLFLWLTWALNCHNHVIDLSDKWCPSCNLGVELLWRCAWQTQVHRLFFGRPLEGRRTFWSEKCRADTKKKDSVLVPFLSNSQHPRILGFVLVICWHGYPWQFMTIKSPWKGMERDCVFLFFFLCVCVLLFLSNHLKPCA